MFGIQFSEMFSHVGPYYPYFRGGPNVRLCITNFSCDKDPAFNLLNSTLLNSTLGFGEDSFSQHTFVQYSYLYCTI